MTDTTTQVPDAWQLDTGLRDDMVIAIHSSYFAPHADYQDGKQLMLWLIGTDENAEAVEVRMSIGADWTTDDGNIVTHPTKKKQHINKNSIYGFFIQYAFEIPDLARAVIERGEALGGMGPRDARVWEGLVIHLQNRELKWGRGIDPQERLMPTEYFGLVSEQNAPAATVPLPPTAPPVATPPGAPPIPPQQAAPLAVGNGPVETLDPAALVRAAQAAQAQAATVSNGSPLYAAAFQLAQQAPDFATFLAQALASPEILADEELAMQCADQSQVWAAAHPA